MHNPLRDHQKDWLVCRRCDLCKTRTNVCLYRGTLPCDILFIGEAPGETEDIFGQPFVGPAGELLDQIIEKSLKEYASTVLWGSNGLVKTPIDLISLPHGINGGRAILKGRDNTYDVIRWAITNIVGCLPVKLDTYIEEGKEIITGRGFREPTKQEAKACEPRLRELITLANPKATVTLGLVAQRYLPKDTGIPNTHLIHPAAILRSERQGLEIKRCVLTLSNLFQRIA